MLNNKGFTLVEVLAVITILGVIMLLIVPTAISVIQGAKDDAYDFQVNEIEKAAAAYASEYASSITELQVTGGTYLVRLGDLIDKGYIDPPVTNPKTGIAFDEYLTYVVITKLSNGNYDYEVTTGDYTEPE